MYEKHTQHRLKNDVISPAFTINILLMIKPVPKKRAKPTRLLFSDFFLKTKSRFQKKSAILSL